MFLVLLSNGGYAHAQRWTMNCVRFPLKIRITVQWLDHKIHLVSWGVILFWINYGSVASFQSKMFVNIDNSGMTINFSWWMKLDRICNQIVAIEHNNERDKKVDIGEATKFFVFFFFHENYTKQTTNWCEKWFSLFLNEANE